jgi:uncharacterized repeat protein (TIGR03803 family)
MSYKKFLGAASAALMIVIAFTLVLAPAADAASKYKVLHAFNGKDGADPSADLIFDAAGNLYGSTEQGGAYGPGTVFKLTPNADGSWTESVLHSFNGSDGQLLKAGLIFDAAGNLYGTTSEGGTHNFGTVFKLTPNADGSWTESVLHYFKPNVLGPEAGLIFDATGNLYGTTYGGGTDNLGTVFKLTPNADGSWTESVLHSFNSGDGANPWAGLIFDATGNLYGTTESGGAHNFGTVFKLTPNADRSWTESVLYRFRGDPASTPIFAGLIFDGAGNLYGTVSGASASSGGAAFKLSPDQDGGWTYSLLHVFQGKPAHTPYGGLVLGSAGTLYGTTGSCSSRCQGVVYQITP